MHFEYKSDVSFTNIQLSITKVAFQFTKWHFGLQFSDQEEKETFKTFLNDYQLK